MFDRCLWSLVNQTRHQTGSTLLTTGSDMADYRLMRADWEGPTV